MSTKLTQCPKCKSYNIKVLNPENRETSSGPLCTLTNECECGHQFNTKSWTRSGKKRGILY